MEPSITQGFGAVFDPNLPMDENNPDILQIHEEYKNLVDYMLGSFMEEMQISPEQFEMACLEGRQQGQGENPFQFHQVLFQQVRPVAVFNAILFSRCHLSDMGRQRHQDIHTHDDAT